MARATSLPISRERAARVLFRKNLVVAQRPAHSKQRLRPEARAAPALNLEQQFPMADYRLLDAGPKLRHKAASPRDPFVPEKSNPSSLPPGPCCIPPIKDMLGERVVS
jgi:hypothetical protein